MTDLREGRLTPHPDLSRYLANPLPLPELSPQQKSLYQLFSALNRAIDGHPQLRDIEDKRRTRIKQLLMLVEQKTMEFQVIQPVENVDSQITYILRSSKGFDFYGGRQPIIVSCRKDKFASDEIEIRNNELNLILQAEPDLVDQTKTAVLFYPYRGTRQAGHRVKIATLNSPSEFQGAAQALSEYLTSNTDSPQSPQNSYPAQ